jgi:dipeptidyl aminopeptidase/acylaminoacyl peptidase
MSKAITKLLLLCGAIAAHGSLSTPLFAAPDISEYGSLPGFEEAVVAPAGNRIAFVARIQNARHIYVIEGDKLLQKISVGDEKIRDLEWASDDLLLVDISQTEKLYGFTAEKAEFYKTMVVSVSNPAPQIVFAKEKEIAKATFGWYGIREVGSKIYGYFAGVPLVKYSTGSNLGEYAYEGGPPALYQVDLATMKAKRVAVRPNDDEWREWRVDAAGNVAATLTMRRGDGKWRINNGTGTVIAEGTSPSGDIDLLALGESGTTIIYRDANPESGASRYLELPLAGGSAAQRFAEIDIDRFFVDQRSGRLVGYLQSGTKPQPHFFDPALQKKVGRISKAFPKVNHHMSDWSNGFAKVILATNGNEDSGTWWTVDLDKLTADPLGYERPQILAKDVGPISTVTYTAKDGLEMDGILTLPPGKEPKKLPVVMLPHGGPTSHDRESFDWWAQAFASRGYAVFQPNFRGSTNRDAAFVKAGHGEWGRKMQTDISDGLAHLAAQGIVDPKRACIVGASYGGYAALAGVTLQKQLYRCSVSVAGVSDLSLMVSTDIYESGNNPMLKRNLTAEIGKGRDLKDVSPRRFASEADAPILLIHGKDDTVVPYRQSIVMADALKDAGKPYELVTLNGEDHWLSKSETRGKMLTTAVSFVEKHNPPN